MDPCRPAAGRANSLGTAAGASLADGSTGRTAGRAAVHTALACSAAKRFGVAAASPHVSSFAARRRTLGVRLEGSGRSPHAASLTRPTSRGEWQGTGLGHDREQRLVVHALIATLERAQISPPAGVRDVGRGQARPSGRPGASVRAEVAAVESVEPCGGLGALEQVARVARAPRRRSAAVRRFRSREERPRANSGIDTKYTVDRPARRLRERAPTYRRLPCRSRHASGFRPAVPSLRSRGRRRREQLIAGGLIDGGHAPA